MQKIVYFIAGDVPATGNILGENTREAQTAEDQ